MELQRAPEVDPKHFTNLPPALDFVAMEMKEQILSSGAECIATPENQEVFDRHITAEYTATRLTNQRRELREAVKAICRQCVVIDKCLQYGLTGAGTSHRAVYGGLDQNERKRYARVNNLKTASPYSFKIVSKTNSKLVSDDASV